WLARSLPRTSRPGALAGAMAPSPMTEALAHRAPGRCRDMNHATADFGNNARRRRSGAVSPFLRRRLWLASGLRESGDRLLPDESLDAGDRARGGACRRHPTADA